jgi:hypothetical protein
MVTVRSDDNVNVRLRQVFMAEDALPTTLLAVAGRVLSLDELASFEPHTIRLELQEALRIPTISVDKFDWVMAGLAIFRSNEFFTEVNHFVDLCNILTDSETEPGDFDPPNSLEMAVAVLFARMIDPLTGEDDNHFSIDVRTFMGAVLAEEGFISAPPSLTEAIIPDRIRGRVQSMSMDADMGPALLETNKLLVDDLEMIVSEVETKAREQLQVVMNA